MISLIIKPWASGGYYLDAKHKLNMLLKISGGISPKNEQLGQYFGQNFDDGPVYMITVTYSNEWGSVYERLEISVFSAR